MRRIVITTGITGTILFLCNISSNYCNIGSITGLIVSILILCVGVYYKNIFYLFNRMKCTKVGKLVRTLIIACISIVLILAFASTFLMIIGGTPYQEGDYTVVILGNGVNDDGTPSQLMKERVDSVIEYIRTHEDCSIIVSGGQEDLFIITEAESMKNYLMEQGVDENRIYMEKTSSSTKKNMEFTAELIRNENLNSNILISTNDFHIYRSAYFAERYGLNSCYIASHTNWSVMPTCWIREMYGILYAWLFHQ